MSFAEYTVFGGGDPLDVVERRRRSPLGLSGAVGAIAADAEDADAEDPAAEGDAPDAAPENDQEDLARVRRALQESKAPGADMDLGGPDGAAGHSGGGNVGAPMRADAVARSLRRFQAAAGLKVDCYARPGGPTDAALDNRRRRVWRLTGQGRRPAEETIDDRLAVFLEGRARRRRIAQDDLAALTESRTGRLHLIRLAPTSDPEAARPIVERELARLRAERSPKRLKGPPDDGSRPVPDGDGAEEPPPKPNDDPPPPSEQDCLERYAAIRRARQRIYDTEGRISLLKERARELGLMRDEVEVALKEKAAEKGLEVIFENIPIKKSDAQSDEAHDQASAASLQRLAKIFMKAVEAVVRAMEDALDPEIWEDVLKFNTAGEEGRRVLEEIAELYAELYVLYDRWQELVGQARQAGCEQHPSEEP